MKSIRRRDRRGLFVLLGVFVMIFLFTFLVNRFKNLDEKVDAASLADFDPGYIISDYQMGNYNSMTEAEIQAFLTKKGNCRDTKTYLASYYPKVSYHIKDGHFVCLAEEVFGDGVSYGDSAPDGETAAHIIWQAAQDYRINPQVLIVLLQKEQGLITDSWPNSNQYRSATGYGCPDTAPCNAEYYGFKNQIRKAAALFRTVLDGGWTNYPLGENYIQYNPASSCGGSVVNIRSLATSALYRYTPYQPNAGALAAGYGTAACGAYGNRNFYLYFEDWFGGVTMSKSPDDILNEKIRAQFDTTNYSGTYNISYSDDGKKYIGLSENNIQTVSANNSDTSQQWVVTKENDYYLITNKKTGKALDLSGGVFSNKANIWQYNLNKTCAQRWNFVKNNDGFVTIHSTCYPQYVLDLADGNTNVQVYKKTSYSNKHQEWILRGVDTVVLDDGEYNVFVSDLDRVVGLTGEKIRVDNLLKMDDTRIWKITKDKKHDFYTIINVRTGKALGINTEIFKNRDKVTLCNLEDNCRISWYFEGFDGGVYIKNAYNQKFVLDLEDGKDDVQIYTRIDSNVHQRWVLNRVDNTNYGGIYNIMYSDGMRSLALEEDSLDSGINTVVDNDYTFDTSQQWVVTKENDYYLITNKKTGKALDLSGGVFSNKANIWQYNLNKTCAQRWNFVKNNDGSVTIHSTCYPQYVLDLADGNTNVQVYKKTSYSNKHQEWILRGVDTTNYSGTYNISYSDDGKKYIGLSENNIQTVSANNSDTSQQWVVTKENDYYLITNKKTGKALDLSGGVFSNKANIWQYNLNKTCAQRWNFVKNNDGSVTIHSTCYPQYVLDLADGNTNVQVYKKTSYSNKHQEWVLRGV